MITVTEWGPLDEAKEFGERFFQAVVTSALALTDIGFRVSTKHLTGEALGLEDLVKQLEEVRKHPREVESVFNEWGDHVAKLHNAFEVLLTTYANELATLNPGVDANNIIFLVLIDDLDRCLPDTTIAILESIKNYLTVKNCIFVLGLNSQVVYQAIRIKYKGLEINGREYLEKILNYTFYVPEPKPRYVVEFATEQFRKLLVNEEDRKRYSGFFTTFGKILGECNFSNPRKIKRILNRYLFFISTYEENILREFNIADIVRLIIIAEFFPSLFRLLLEDTSTSTEVLSKLSGNFDVGKFETRYGVNLFDKVSRIKRMNKLFELEIRKDARKSFDEHVQSVFAITRLV